MELRRCNSVYYELTNITPLQFKVLCLLVGGFTASEVMDELGCRLDYIEYIAERMFKYYRSTKFKD